MLVLALFLLAPSAIEAVAQGAPTATRVYTALFNIRYSDVPAWTANYRNHGVPILQSMVDDGRLIAFDARLHHTGGPYTIRQAFVGDEDTDFDAVWEAYLGGLGQADAAAFERVTRMIVSHADEIWEIDVSNNVGTRYLYSADFQVNFADLERWNALWRQDVLPSLDRAMADGLLQGYMIQGHNTGGPYNWKILYFYDEWDNLDELEAALFSAVPLDHPIWSMPTAHRDDLWQALPPEQ